MTLDTQASFTYIAEMVDGIPGIVKTYNGVPDSIEAGAVAYVALLGQNVPMKVQGVIRRAARIMVTLAYRVIGAEANAEAKLAANIDEIILAYFADRTLGGTCQNSEIDLSIPDAPDYRALAGQEYRMYPIVITAFQDHTVGT